MLRCRLLRTRGRRRELVFRLARSSATDRIAGGSIAGIGAHGQRAFGIAQGVQLLPCRVYVHDAAGAGFAVAGGISGAATRLREGHGSVSPMGQEDRNSFRTAAPAWLLFSFAISRPS